MTEMRTAAIGAMLVVLGPISLSLYTPAMPALVEAFETTPAAVKLTLTLYFCGFALAQLVCGPLTDAYGRRPVGIGFFAIYLAGSCVAAASPSLEWLLVGRTLQGIGAAAGIAVSRAMVRDQFVGQASARIMNLIGVMLAIGPAVSPTLGGIILGSVGWHAIFLVMLAYGALLILLLSVAVPETNRQTDRALARPRRVASSYGELLRDKRFVGAALLMAVTPGGIYTLAAILPFVMIERVGFTPMEFGFSMLVQTGAYLAGAVVAGRLLRTMEAHRLVPVGLAIVVLGGLGFLVGLRVWPPSFLTVMGPVGLWAFGNAFIMPSTTSDALADFPHIAGAAAALTGFAQIGGGFVGSAAAALLFADPFQSLITIMPVMALIGVAVYVGLVRPAGVPTPLEPDVEEVEDLELAVDPVGLVGAGGSEIEAVVARRMHERIAP